METIFLCLPSSKVVIEITEKILRAPFKIDMIIVCTTSSPARVITINKIFSDANINYLEAPLTGGVTQALEGKLGAILGGTEDAV